MRPAAALTGIATVAIGLAPISGATASTTPSAKAPSSCGARSAARSTSKDARPRDKNDVSPAQAAALEPHLRGRLHEPG
jgi:hypothetical protein